MIVDYAIVDVHFYASVDCAIVYVRVDMVHTFYVRVDMVRTRGALQDMHHVTPGPDDMAVLYTDDIIIASAPACYEAFDLWLAQIPLHCFDIVEMHYPNRVIW